jgi:hypothetical protein
MGMFTENEEKDKYRQKLEWVARNLPRIKDFAFTGDVYRVQINESVDYIIKSINKTLGIEEGQ